MPIAVSCPQCDVRFPVDEKFSGKRIRCRTCQFVFTVPQIVDAESADPVDEAFAGGAPRVSPRVSERRRENDDRRPHERDIKRSSGSGILVPLLIVGGVVGVFLVVVVIGLGAWLMLSREARIAKAPPPVVVALAPPGEMPVERKRGEQVIALNPAGNCSVADRIGPADSVPIEGQNRLCRVYDIALNAGVDYQIDLSSPEMDSFLFVAEANGNVVAKDDDGGGGLNSMVRLRPWNAQQYRIYATSLGGRSVGNFTLTIRKIGFLEKGIPVDPPQKIRPQDPAPTAQQLAGVEFVILTKGRPRCDGVVWAEDGKSIYSATTDGRLQRFDVVSGDLIAEHDFERQFGNLALSGAGLLLSVPSAQEVWVIDPSKLGDVKKKMPVPSIERVSAGWKSSLAVASGPRGETLHLIDLQAGEVLKQYERVEGKHLIVSPDGEYAFGQGGREQLNRFRVTREGLFKEEEGLSIAVNGQRVCVSPDGRYVALPSGGGNAPVVSDHPRIGSYSTYVYPTDNLRRPDFSVSSGPYPRCMGFDPISGHVLAQSQEKTLILFTFTGIKRSEHIAPGFRGGNEIAEISVSPLGYEAVLRDNSSLILARLKKS